MALIDLLRSFRDDDVACGVFGEIDNRDGCGLKEAIEQQQE
jgi:hypothetical protein